MFITLISRLFLCFYFVNKKDANVSKAHEDFYNVIILGADYAE